MRKFLLSLSLVISLGMAASLIANDSSTSDQGGQLRFLRDPDVILQSELLELEPSVPVEARTCWVPHEFAFTVTYQMRNTSTQPKRLNLGFPLPDADLADMLSEGYDVSQKEPPRMELKVDGRDLKGSGWRETLLYHGEALTGLSWKKFPPAFKDRCQPGTGEKCSPAEKKVCDLLDQKTQTKGCSAIDEIKVQRVYSWNYTFPPRKTIKVVHRYRMSGSFGIRETEGNGDRFCLKAPSILPLWKSYEALFPLANGDAGRQHCGESFIGYVLKTGANWAAPIGQFRLRVKAGPEFLVSTCFSGLKPVQEDWLEATRDNLTPKEDLWVLYFPRAEKARDELRKVKSHH